MSDGGPHVGEASWWQVIMARVAGGTQSTGVAQGNVRSSRSNNYLGVDLISELSNQAQLLLPLQVWT